MTQSLEIRRKRLRYHCWHRGTKELDLLIGPFADAHLARLDEGQLDRLEALLEVPEPMLYDWLLERSTPTPELDSDVFRMLLSHCTTANQA